MKVLDLFCGSGGASIGYAAAGMHVTGVDISPQPNYPFEFIQADALDVSLDGYDLIHASPPCQGYSPHVSSSSSKWAGTSGKMEPRLIGSIRDRLMRSGADYVIENVIGARMYMRSPVLLCGTMFGLPIPRHRLFESSIAITAPFHKKCRGVAKQYAEARGWDHRDMTVTGKGRGAGTKERWMEIMGWPVKYTTTQHGLRESIPPCYTKFIAEAMAQQWGNL